jgi:alpha-tubulin suppressor-like RCC1 family protein
LYTCGENTFGQLGLGHTREQTIFQRVNLDNVAFATTGGNFSAVITNNGNLYSCGQVSMYLQGF